MILLASPADAQIIARIINVSFSAQPLTQPPPSALQVNADNIRSHFAAGGSAMLAIDEDDVIGAVLWAPEDEGWRLCRLSVVPSARRRGVGGLLLNQVSELAAARQIKSLLLATRLSLLGNRALFAAADYREISLHCHLGFQRPTFVELIHRRECWNQDFGLPVFKSSSGLFSFAVETPAYPDVPGLLQRIAAHSAALYPPEGIHMLAAERLVEEDVVFIVARDASGGPAACGAVVQIENEAEIKRMFVEDRVRGQGLGGAVLSLLELRAYRHGARVVRLETGPKQPAAIRLYETLGYVHRGPFGAYVESPYSVFMEKLLV